MRERWVLSDGGCTEGKVWFFWTEPKSCVKITRILSISWHSIAHFVNCIALTVLFEIAGNSADEGCANFFYSTLHRGECLRQVNLVEFWEAILFFGRTVIPVLLSLFFFVLVWKAAEDCANSSSKSWFVFWWMIFAFILLFDSAQPVLPNSREGSSIVYSKFWSGIYKKNFCFKYCLQIYLLSCLVYH